MRQANLISFMGASGGAGVTSLCIQVAYSIVQHRLGKVCLVDLDFENGMISQYLNMAPSLTVDDLATDPMRIDEELSAFLISRHKTGLDVFSSKNKINGNKDVNPASVLQFLDRIADTYDYIIIDLPRQWTDWTFASISTSDRFCMVAELTIPSLHNLKAKEIMIQNSLAQKRHIDVLLNKHERRSFKNQLRVKDVNKILSCPASGTVGLYTDDLKEAINRGVPLGVSKPECKYVKDIAKILDVWVNHSSARLIA